MSLIITARALLLCNVAKMLKFPRGIYLIVFPGGKSGLDSFMQRPSGPDGYAYALTVIAPGNTCCLSWPI